MWSCAFSPHCPTSLYSGGDDCLLRHSGHPQLCSSRLALAVAAAHGRSVLCAAVRLLSPPTGHRLLRRASEAVGHCATMRRPLGESAAEWRSVAAAVGQDEQCSRRRRSWRTPLGCCAAVCMPACSWSSCKDGGASLRAVERVLRAPVAGLWWQTGSHMHDKWGSRARASGNNGIVSCSFYDNSLRLWQPVNMSAIAAAGEDKQSA